MAEHDYVIANQNGANTRSDLNNALAAIVSNNSKASAPTTTYAYMWWADTANDILKQRNGADSAWISILTLSTGAPLAGMSDIVDDTTPQLGGDLDFQTHKATSFTSTGIDDNATSTAITIDASENVEINTGNLVIGTSGKGIDFSADGNAAGMTSEVLDDYETGTFTPTLTFGGASVGITYNTTKTYGWYTKIGNVVNIQLYIYLSAKGTSTGDAVIGGLPVASAAGSDKYTPMSFLGNRVSLANNHASFIGNSATTIALRETSLAGTLTTLTSGNFVDNSAFMVNITYRTD